MAKNKVRVRITARQTVRYDKIVEMTKKEWERFKEMSPTDHVFAGGDIVGGWLDAVNDIDDADDIDEEDFDAEVVDNKGKPTGDRYTGGL